ncbi:MAG: ABC transporter permease [Ilumatobacter sp.]|jgi:ABC-2 type transport system permease protein|uniref:ABC transporter permease n=1 Tax=Ilumatobacter sp. TaxID=1967498 RepID=UPI00391B11FA
MTIAPPVATAIDERRLDPSTIAQTWAMSKRAIIALARQPALVVPSIIFPLFFAALGTASFGRAIDVPGFPEVDSYLDFALAGAIAQGVLFGSTVGATALATDIENGFFDRLLSSPTSRTSIIVGRMAGGMVYGAVQSAFFVAVLLPFGLSIKGGVVAVIGLVIAGTFLALAVGALMATMAIATGSSEATQGAFPLLFIALFFSSSFFPRETMSGIYATLADWNPISHLVEGMRDLVIEGASTSALVRAIAIPAVLSVLTVALAVRSLHRRLGAS